MPSNSSATDDPYGEFEAELKEIDLHKWNVSVNEGRDIGFERALTEWSQKHRTQWRRERREAKAQEGKSKD